MATVKDVGLTLKTIKKGEFDRTLTLLLSEHGLSTAFAKGAARSKSAFFAAAQPFAISRFVLFEGRGFLSVASAEVERGFFGISSDYERFYAACAVIETVSGFVMPGISQTNTLRLVSYALSSIEKSNTPSLAAAIFKIKYLQAEGLLAQDDEFNRDHGAINFIIGLDQKKAFGFYASQDIIDSVIFKSNEITNNALNRRLKTTTKGIF